MIFYHVYAVNNWKWVVQDQLSKLIYSGLYNYATEARLTLDIQWQSLAANRDCVSIPCMFISPLVSRSSSGYCQDSSGPRSCCVVAEELAPRQTCVLALVTYQ